MTNDTALSRRTLLGALGVFGVAAASGALTISLPHPAAAQTFGQQETVEDALKRLFAGRPLKDAGNLVKLDVPLIAENGAAVKVEVEATSPMTSANHVKHIYVVADKNRIPVVTRVALSPESGQAYMAANEALGLRRTPDYNGAATRKARCSTSR